jgi:proteasome assembly chaperone (PAC2) family protein
MAEKLKLTRPWLVAVWPGMGQVALNAGIYLLSKLGMNAFAEYDASELFDVEQVEVKEGIIQPGRRPRNRFFVWYDPNKKHDLVVFMGEAQPPSGKYAFCRNVIAFAKDLGVVRVFTFAAMATRMDPNAESRVFGAATDSANLEELQQLELDILEDGQIGGLNGILLGAATEAGLPGACLLGEMPHIFAQIPYPKASHAILEAFTTLADIDLDLEELADQARLVDEQLGELLERAQEQQGGGDEDEDESDDEGSFIAESVPEDEEPPPPIKFKPGKREQIESLFSQSENDRSKAFELKRELDRRGLFKEYEDRFLDLFKKPD